MHPFTPLAVVRCPQLGLALEMSTVTLLLDVVALIVPSAAVGEAMPDVQVANRIRSLDKRDRVQCQ